MRGRNKSGQGLRYRNEGGLILLGRSLSRMPPQMRRFCRCAAHYALGGTHAYQNMISSSVKNLRHACQRHACDGIWHAHGKAEAAHAVNNKLRRGVLYETGLECAHKVCLSRHACEGGWHAHGLKQHMRSRKSLWGGKLGHAQREETCLSLFLSGPRCNDFA